MAIEQRVFQGLGGQGRGELLEVAQRPRPRAAQGGGGAFLLGLAGRAIQPLIQQRQQAAVGAVGRGGQAGARAGQGDPPMVAIGGAATAILRITAIRGKRRQQRAQHAVDGGRGPVAGAQVEPGDPGERAHQHQPLGGEVARQHQLARPQQLRRWRPAVAGERLPEGLQRLPGVGLVQQRADLVHEIVAGGAIDGPARVEGFVLGEDFLHDQVRRA